MAAGDLAQALAVPAIAEDGITIDSDRLPSDVPSLELGPPHACADPFDDEVAFEFGDGADDDHDGPA